MSSLSEKKVFITGSTGFVGSNLTRRSFDRGAEVFINIRNTSDTWRIRDILDNLNVISVDILEYIKLKDILKEIQPDIIFHTATYGGNAWQKDTEKIIDTNYIGTVNLLRISRDIHVNLFVNTGSSSEYGIKNAAMSESDLLEPVTDYGVSKAAATLFCQMFAITENLPIVTLRLFSPYGQYEHKSRLVPSVVLAALQKINPKISSRQFVRDFIFIEDVLNAYEAVLDLKNASGKIFNIGSGQQHSVGEVVDKIIAILGNEVTYEVGFPQVWKNEPTFWKADIQRAISELGWEPKYSLEKGLAATIDWFKLNKELYR